MNTSVFASFDASKKRPSETLERIAKEAGISRRELVDISFVEFCRRVAEARIFPYIPPPVKKGQAK